MSGTGLGGLFGAAGDLFGGIMGDQGYQAAASGFNQAAKYAEENAAVAKRSGQIEETQVNRQIYQAISGQQSDIAGAGFASGGSGQWLQRAATQQGGLTKAIVANNAQMQVQGYEAQAASDTAQANEATAQGNAALGGGILGTIGSLLGI